MVSTPAAERLPFRRVFLTGATGFVGGHLVPVLQAALAPDSVVTVGTQSGTSPFEGTIPTVFDLRDEFSIRSAIEATRPDLVVHLAGEASVTAATEAAGQAWRTNAFGSLALARAIASTSPAATVLFVSSAEVYGEAYLTGTVDEKTPTQPKSVYAMSKRAAEDIFATVLGKDATVISARPCNHTGPGQSEAFALPSFALQIARAERLGKPAIINVGNLDSARDFLDVRDVVRAYVALLGSAALFGRRSTFNVSSGQPRIMRTILDSLRALATIETTVEIDPLRQRPSEIPFASIDSNALRLATGWEPQIPFDQTLADLMDHIRARLERFSAE